MSAPRRRTRRAGATRVALNAAGELREDAFQAQVVGLAGFYGWLAYHAPAGGKDGRVDTEQVGAGFPDLILIRGPELLAVELKPDKVKARALAKLLGLAERPEWLKVKDVTDGQARWLEAFSELGGHVAAAVVLARQRPGGAFLGADADATPRVEAHLWRPADWDELEARLARGRYRVPMAR